MVGHTIVRTLLYLAVAPDSGLAVNAGNTVIAGFVVHDNTFAGTVNDDPINSPDRDWYGRAVIEMQAGSTNVNTPVQQTFWEFRSRRRIADQADRPLLVVGTSASACHLSLTVLTLLALP